MGTVLVRGALPGEVVRVGLRSRKHHLEGQVLDILQAHPERYPDPLPPTADLPLYYSAQLPLKQGLVHEALGRIAKLEFPLSPIQPSPEALGYRTAAQYALHPSGGLAYRKPDSHQLVKLEQDPLIAPPLQEAFRLLSRWPLSNLDEVVLRGSLYEGRTLVGLIGGEAHSWKPTAQALVREGLAGVVWAEVSPKGRFRGRVRRLAGEGGLLEEFGGVLSTVEVQSFAQVNPKAAGLLYQEAARIVGNGGRAIELYAGSGVLGLHLAERFCEVIAVEISRDAVKRGEADRERLGVSHLRFHRGDARELSRFTPADLVAVDPPRSGLAAEVMQAIVQARPRRVLYVSCDPATWARDVRGLTQAGYRLAFARPYDFYPFTHHVEVLSLLER
ncbi:MULTISPECIES: class I SAM-dependent RNA methyltransferase [unclassified Meiothermus]|uniref:class I SAM-dependent RNA methyltransferase n=1 Tax=unclassified Meiothermus TaxID=370471 RepID=UPI000D7BAAB3|nr:MULTISPECIES: methyltransferase domain-containing protein [unclassified Meiothermus]PZA08457.1 RNA methyltransferase [Meiothermus sp. Pnk-1]RYM39022.1 class I SAM-dependent RNA methyltransferase [Meiothermus sp. PNK-Is4]